jgi:hypothetical protein
VIGSAAQLLVELEMTGMCGVSSRRWSGSRALGGGRVNLAARQADAVAKSGHPPEAA